MEQTLPYTVATVAIIGFPEEELRHRTEFCCATTFWWNKWWGDRNEDELCVNESANNDETRKSIIFNKRGIQWNARCAQWYLGFGAILITMELLNSL